MLEIDYTKCNRDYICIDECPYGFIYEINEDGYPAIHESLFERYCIQCWHCVAICPKGAISGPGIWQNRLEKSAVRDALSHDQVEYVLRTRRSFRTFQKEPVSREIISKWLDVTRWAPTASNAQQIHWILIQDPQKVSGLAGLMVDWLREKPASSEIVEQWEQGRDILLRQAPHLLIATLPEDSFWAMTDAATAISYLELSARSLGLGTCWAGYLTRAVSEYAPLRKALDLPGRQKVAGALMFGYPVYRFPRIPARKPVSIQSR